MFQELCQAVFIGIKLISEQIKNPDFKYLKQHFYYAKPKPKLKHLVIKNRW